MLPQPGASLSSHAQAKKVHQQSKPHSHSQLRAKPKFTDEEYWERKRANQMHALDVRIAPTRSAKTAQLVAHAAEVQASVQGVPSDSLSPLELVPAALLSRLILSQLDVSTLLSVGRCSKTLWKFVAMEPATWTNTLPPAFHISIGSKPCESPGAWSLLARHLLYLRWPATGKRNQEAIDELQQVLATVPFVGTTNFVLDLASSTSGYGHTAYHSLCSVNAMWLKLLSHDLLRAVTELYLDGAVTPYSTPAWHPLTPDIMALVAKLPAVHTLSVHDDATGAKQKGTLIQHLDGMAKLTALRLTSSRHLNSTQVESIARCPSLRKLHLKVLNPSSSAVEPTSDGMLLFPVFPFALVEQVGIEMAPSVEQFRDPFRLVEPPAASSAAAGAANEDPSPTSELREDPMVNLRSLHLFKETASVCMKSKAGLNLLVSNLARWPGLHSLHLHFSCLFSDSEFAAYSYSGTFFDAAAYPYGMPAVRGDRSTLLLAELLAQTRSQLHVHVYFNYAWENQPVESCVPSDAETGAVALASRPSSAGRLHVWDHSPPQSTLRRFPHDRGSTPMQLRRPAHLAGLSPKQQVQYLQLLARKEKQAQAAEAQRLLDEQRHQRREQYTLQQNAFLAQVAPADDCNLQVQLHLVLSAARREQLSEMSLSTATAAELSVPVCVGTTLAELTQVASDLTDFPLHTFELRLLNALPFTAEQQRLTLLELDANGKTLVQVMKRGHVPKPAAPSHSVWHQGDTHIFGFLPTGFNQLGAALYPGGPKLMDLVLGDYCKISGDLNDADADTQAKFVTTFVERAVQNTLDPQSVDRTAILIQCLCADGFLQSDAVYRGLLSLRVSINIRQRNSAVLIAEGFISNFHPRLTAVIDSLQAGPALALTPQQVQALTDSIERLPSVEDAVSSPRSKPDPQLARQKSRSAYDRKWKAYDEIASKIAQPSFRSASVILDLQVPMRFESQAPGANGDGEQPALEAAHPASSSAAATADPIYAVPGDGSASTGSSPSLSASQLSSLLAPHRHLASLLPEPSLSMIAGILSKLVAAGESPPTSALKFRRLKLDHPTVQQKIVGVDGAVELMLAIGFQRKAEVPPMPGAEAGSSASSVQSTSAVGADLLYLVFPYDAPLLLPRLVLDHVTALLSDICASRDAAAVKVAAAGPGDMASSMQ